MLVIVWWLLLRQMLGCAQFTAERGSEKATRIRHNVSWPLTITVPIEAETVFSLSVRQRQILKFRDCHGLVNCLKFEWQANRIASAHARRMAITAASIS